MIRTVLILFLMMMHLLAGGQEFHFKYLTPQDGLVDGTINAIMQDSSGLMWFATWDGLISYDGYRLQSYKPELGDPNSLTARQVYKLFLDSRDHIWISTFFGICRYDKIGDKFDRFTIQDHPREMRYRIKFIEIDGTIVIRSPQGLWYYPMEKEGEDYQFSRLLYNDSETAQFNNLNMINRVIDGHMVLTRYNAVNNNTTLYFAELFHDGDQQTFRLRDQIITAGNVTDLLQVSGNLFAVTGEGIKIINRGNREVMNGRLIVNEPGISYVINASDQSLWIVFQNSGIGRYNIHTGEFTRIKYDPNIPGSLLSHQVESIFEDFSANLWFGHRGAGLSILPLRKEAFHTVNYDPSEKNSVSHPTIMCFARFGDAILIGTDGNGLDIMQRDTRTGKCYFENAKFPEDFKYAVNYKAIWCIMPENDREFWMGGNFGLCHAGMSPDGLVYKQYDCWQQTSIIRKVFIDENKNMWLGTYNGLYLWPAAKRQLGIFELYSYGLDDDSENQSNSPVLADKTITDILLDSKGRFWVSTQNGGLHLLAKEYKNLDLSGNIKPDLDFIWYNSHYRSPGGLNNNEINSIMEHYDGTIWCCTQGGGINIFNPESGTFSYITVDDGLPGRDVFGILPDEYGHLWASTNRGLSRIDVIHPRENILNFSPSDGIHGHIFMVNSFFRDVDGVMYFGGRQGFTYFKPEEIFENGISPKIRFTDLKILHKPVAIGDAISKHVILTSPLNESASITLSHKEYNLSIGIAVIHFDEPGENKIKYMLEGYDRDWITVPASEKYLNYSNLSQGTYTLRVRGVNSDNILSQKERTLTITITPPWWKEWYSILGGIFILISIIGAVIFLILHRAVLQHNLQIEKMEKENIERINESKLQFFTDISHELKTPLSLVIAPLEDLTDETNRYENHYFRKQARLILRNAKLLKRLIDQVIDFRKANAGKLTLSPEKQEIGIFMREIIQHFEIYQTNKKNRLIHHIPEEPLMVSFDAQKVEKIIYNLLSNAFKHASQNGIIIVSLEKARKNTDYHNHTVDGVIISVYNEGDYIPEDEIEKIFERFYKTDNLSEGSGIGLAITKSLVELHHGSIEVESNEGDGATFTVFLPMNQGETGDGHGPAMMKPGIDRESYPREMESLQVESLEEYSLNKDLKVLLIEDNKELRDFLKTILERYFDYHEAPDGNSGLQMAEELIPDVIISDVIMPGKDGFEVCKSLKENIRTCHIPVVLLTAKSAPEHMVDGYDAGADAYVSKPFEIKVLLTQVSRLIKNRELIRNKFREQNFMIDRPEHLYTKDEVFLETLNEEIRKNITVSNFNVSRLSEILDLSPTQIYRKIKAITGFTSVEYIRIIKLNKAAEMLKTHKFSVKEVCYKSGFNDPSYFVRCFKGYYKMTPSGFMYKREYRESIPD
ncbi:MAG: response regulator [Bacteroidales bacterium]|nr:response regulator [Bacteroidales bacterium]